MSLKAAYTKQSSSVFRIITTGETVNHTKIICREISDDFSQILTYKTEKGVKISGNSGIEESRGVRENFSFPSWQDVTLHNLLKIEAAKNHILYLCLKFSDQEQVAELMEINSILDELSTMIELDKTVRVTNIKAHNLFKAIAFTFRDMWKKDDKDVILAIRAINHNLRSILKSMS